MLTSFKRMVPPTIRQTLKSSLSFRQWRARDYGAPSPGSVKQRVLLRNAAPSCLWVETGTYLGDTAAFLAGHSSRVITIEPAPAIYALASQRLARFRNVKVINGASEDVFPRLLPQLSGAVSFWLDGHYSGGVTWATYQGSTSTPIKQELEQIESNRTRFSALSVLIDDIRSFEFSAGDSSYPQLDYLVDWARGIGLRWHIEHDIFVARRL
jgi:hypothetical protein